MFNTHVPFTLLLLLLNTTCTTIYNDAGTYVHAHVLRHCHMNSVQLLYHASLPSTTTTLSLHTLHPQPLHILHPHLHHPPFPHIMLRFAVPFYALMHFRYWSVVPGLDITTGTTYYTHRHSHCILSPPPLHSTPLHHPIHHPIHPSISYSTSHHPSHHVYKLPFCITLTRPCVSHISYSFHALQRHIQYLGFGSSQVRTNTDYGVAGVSPAPIYHTYSP